MNADSLKITQNEDGSYTMGWDKEDPNWKWSVNTVVTLTESRSVLEKPQ